MPSAGVAVDELVHRALVGRPHDGVADLLAGSHHRLELRAPARAPSAAPRGWAPTRLPGLRIHWDGGEEDAL
eukprot:1317912-Lingulodinium_polyedra.AAC.1